MGDTTDTDDSTDDGAALAAIEGSDNRRKVLSALADSAGTPTDIAARAMPDLTDEGARSEASRKLRDLREVGAVALAVPESKRKGRVYQITAKGERVLSRVEGESDE